MAGKKTWTEDGDEMPAKKSTRLLTNCLGVAEGLEANATGNANIDR